MCYINFVLSVSVKLRRYVWNFEVEKFFLTGSANFGLFFVKCSNKELQKTFFVRDEFSKKTNIYCVIVTLLSKFVLAQNGLAKYGNQHEKADIDYWGKVIMHRPENVRLAPARVHHAPADDNLVKSFPLRKYREPTKQKLTRGSWLTAPTQRDKLTRGKVGVQCW